MRRAQSAVRRSTAALVTVACLLTVGPARADDQDESAGEQAQHQAVHSMTMPLGHHDAHMRWTPTGMQTPADRQRADRIVQTLRAALEKYKDYRLAIEDGYKPFLPHIPQPRYHFTNNWNAFKGAFSFDPAKPTSLIYKKTSDGYALIGAMYTAPKRMAEEKLNERVPLSITHWHAHVNICLPPKSKRANADWTRFGFRGSITTEQECDEAGGTFYPQLFGWMVHVNPFEDSPDRIWAHDPTSMQ